MKPPVVSTLLRLFSRRHLLFLNGLLCMAYPLCYAIVMLLTFTRSDPASPPRNGVVLINLLFLAILVLNTNLILVLYRLLPDPKPFRTRLVFRITYSTWLFYALVSSAYTVFLPGFNSRFYHFVTYEFRMMDPGFFFLLSIFGGGMSYLTWQYYSQRDMKRFACYLIIVVLLFSFKMMLPYFLFMMSWIFLAGFNFCVYYETAERRAGSREVRTQLVGEATIVPD